MTRPTLTLVTAFVLLLQALVGLSPARAMVDMAPVAMCHSGSDPAPASNDVPASHDCLACPICAGATASLSLIPPPPELPLPRRVGRVEQPLAATTAPAPARSAANPSTGPPRLA